MTLNQRQTSHTDMDATALDSAGVAWSSHQISGDPAVTAGMTLLQYLVQRFPHVGAAVWAARCARGVVRDEHGNPARAEQGIRVGATFLYRREVEAELSIPFDLEIVYRDERLVVVDKPHFLAVTPSGRFARETVLARLARELGVSELTPLHRLDRLTAGILLVSVDRRSRDAYQSLFRERRIEKRYEARVQRWPAALPSSFLRESRLVPGEPFFRMREEPGEPNAQTAIRLLEAPGSDGSAVVELSPVSGRKHQLRVQLAGLGAPIVNDDLYPELRRGPDDPDDFARPLALLARELRFTDPVSGEARCFRSVRELPSGSS